MMLKNDQTYFKNLAVFLAVFTSQDFKCMLDHFSTSCMKGLISLRKASLNSTLCVAHMNRQIGLFLNNIQFSSNIILVLQWILAVCLYNLCENRATLDGESLDGVSENSTTLLKVLRPSQAQTRQELTEVFLDHLRGTVR